MNNNELIIAIEFSDIIYVVQNTTHKYGRALLLPDKSNIEQVYELQADYNDSDMAIIESAIVMHSSAVIRMCNRYVVDHEIEIDRLLMTLSFPDNRSTTNNAMLKSSIFGYMTKAVTYEFLKVIDHRVSSIYLQSAAMYENSIMMNIHSRVAGGKKPLAPF